MSLTALFNTMVSPVLMHWRYHGVELGHQYIFLCNTAGRLEWIASSWNLILLASLPFVPVITLNLNRESFRVLFQCKDHLSRYRHSHYKDERVMKLYYLCNKNSYTGKTTSLYWVVSRFPIYSEDHVSLQLSMEYRLDLINIVKSLIKVTPNHKA